MKTFYTFGLTAWLTLAAGFVHAQALEFSVAGLPNGLYLVRLVTESGSITEKFMLQR